MFNMIKKLLIPIYGFLFRKYCKYLYNRNPRKSAELYVKLNDHRMPNLENPKDLVDKNIWLALNTDTTIWSRCTDKYAVRSYVKECGLGDILNELYAKWDNTDEIDFDALPEQFVIKTNNGCATVLIVTDKNSLDEVKTRKILNKWLKREYGYYGYNGHYLRISPCLICEKYLKDNNTTFRPIDYKFYCTYGKPLIVEVITGRSSTGHNSVATLYDLNWEVVHESSSESDKLVPKPQSFDKMLHYCDILAKDFPFVRVDFYEIDGKPIFGELTFTPEVQNFSYKVREEIANQIILPHF